MKHLIRIAEKSDLPELILLYEKNGLAPTKTVCQKSVDSLNNFLTNSNCQIIVCLYGGKIVASCEVSVVPSLSYFSGGNALVSAMCYESESCYEELSLLVSKVKEIAMRQGCKKILFLNENCCGFLNTIFMSSGLRNENCYAK